MLQSRFTSATVKSTIVLTEPIKIHMGWGFHLLLKATSIKYLGREHVFEIPFLVPTSRFSDEAYR